MRSCTLPSVQLKALLLLALALLGAAVGQDGSAPSWQVVGADDLELVDVDGGGCTLGGGTGVEWARQTAARAEAGGCSVPRLSIERRCLSVPGQCLSSTCGGDAQGLGQGRTRRCLHRAVFGRHSCAVPLAPNTPMQDASPALSSCVVSLLRCATAVSCLQ